MAGQTLTTTILINARADGSLGEVGNTLMELGAMVDQISQKAQQFGKESIETYKEFDDSMHEAEVALSTQYGQNTYAMKQVMDSLTEQASEWASTTIFHTDDVANAIAEAAHAGWDYDMIMQGIPQSIRLAQAGNIDLSTAISYVTAAAKAGGIEFENLGTFIDEWAFSANSSRGTIDDFGQTMMRMQSIMRLTDSSEELMTLIALTADAGSTGTEAGTMIRNAILRLAAPTKTAKELMDGLGASYDEANEIFADPSLAEANKTLEKYGFTAYDQQGNLKSILQIFDELYVATQGMTEAERTPLLESLFGKRGLTEGMNLLQAASEDYKGLYEQLMNGEAEGYAAFAQEKMSESLGNKMELFESKVEELRRAVGEGLAGDLENVMTMFGGFIDDLSGMDDTKMAVFISGLEVLAGLGPGLIATGMGFKAMDSVRKFIASFGIGTAAPYIAGIAGVAAAMTMLKVSADKVNAIEFENMFGDLTMDNSDIVQYANGIAEAFDATYGKVQAAREEINGMVDDYQNDTADLMKDLITKTFTDEELTAEDKRAIRGKVNKIKNEIKDVFEGNEQADELSVSTMLGEDNTLSGSVMSVIRSGIESDIAEAEALSEQLRKAITSAFADNSLSPEELEGIQNYYDQLDEIIAKQVEKADWKREQSLLRNAQTLGLDAITGTLDEFSELKDSRLSFLASEQDDLMWDFMQGLEAKGIKGAAADKRIAAFQNELDKAYGEAASSFMKPLFDIADIGARGSDMADAWGALKEFATDVSQNGWTQGAYNAFYDNENVSRKDLEHLPTYVDTLVEALGGIESLDKYISTAQAAGDTEMETNYQMAQAMYNLAHSDWGMQETAYTAPQAVESAAESASTESAAAALQEIAAQTGQSVDMISSIVSSGELSQMGDGLEAKLSAAAESFGMDISGFVAQAMSEISATATTGAMVETETATPTTSADIDATVNVITDAAQAAIDELDGQDLTENVDGDNSGLASSIDAQDGRTIITHVDGETSRLASAISSFGNRTVYVNVVGRKMGAFAEGGRTTSPAIFGEGSTPEWAIPEAHTERTAELLNAAREASGFTWSDLLARYGGLNANPVSEPSTIVYSPTINANDASGVDAILREDKFRLERWFEERQMRERMEVYA